MQITRAFALLALFAAACGPAPEATPTDPEPQALEARTPSECCACLVDRGCMFVTVGVDAADACMAMLDDGGDGYDPACTAGEPESYPQGVCTEECWDAMSLGAS